MTDLAPLQPPAAASGKTKGGWVRTAVGLIAGVGVGLAFGYFVGRTLIRPGGESDLTIPGALLLFAGVIIMTVLAILLHELGHLAGGKLAGFRFVLLIVGPLRVQRAGMGLRWTVNRSPGMAGGLALSLPTRAESALGGYRLLVAGGPVTSLVLGVSSGAAALFWEPAGAVGDALFPVLLLFSVANLVIGAATLLPLTTGGFQSDGRRLLDMWRNQDAALANNRVVTANGLLFAGVRPREWDAAMIAGVAELQTDGALDASAAALLYVHALDTGVLADARDHLQRMLDLNHLLPDPAQHEALFEAVFFEAWLREDPMAAARFMPEKPSVGLGEKVTLLKAQAALALRREAWAEADALLAEAERENQQSIAPGSAVITAEFLQQMRAFIPASENSR